MQQSAVPTTVSLTGASRARTGDLPVSSGFLFMAVLLEPIYLWPSGLPQISDAFYVGFVVASFFAVGYRAANHLFFILLCLFVFWVFSVTAFWAVYLSIPAGMLHAAFIIYNATVCWQIASHAPTSDKLLKAIAVAGLVSLCAQALLLIALPSESGRATGSTNNPNQLAYWGVNAMAVSLLAGRYWSAFRRWSLLAAAASAVVILLSISKAAAAALVMILSIMAVQSRKGRVLVALGFLLSPLVILTLGQIQLGDSELYSQWQHRILERGGGLDPSKIAAGREYDRLVRYPQFLVLGASEIAPDRFGGIEKEIHSTFGNLAYSYGVIGLLLFLTILAVAMHGNLHNAVFLLPAIIYGFTHNGIRSTLLWVLIGMLVGLSARREPNPPIGRMRT